MRLSEIPRQTKEYALYLYCLRHSNGNRYRFLPNPPTFDRIFDWSIDESREIVLFTYRYISPDDGVAMKRRSLSRADYERYIQEVQHGLRDPQETHSQENSENKSPNLG